MKRICPFCKKLKETVGPKMVSLEKQSYPKMTHRIDVIKTVVMCSECNNLYKNGKIDINIKE